MTVFPDTQAVGLEGSRRATARETFTSQTPLALVAIFAIVAIVAVNSLKTPESSVAAAAPGSQSTAGSISCPDCGEVVAIKPIPAAERGAAGPDHRFAVEVRMSDGSLRIVKQVANGFDVGDRVRVSGNALTIGR
ncbi:MAG: hypothetical protein ACK4V1_03015 [Burkholderiaceae bacterium]